MQSLWKSDVYYVTVYMFFVFLVTIGCVSNWGLGFRVQLLFVHLLDVTSPTGTPLRARR